MPKRGLRRIGTHSGLKNGKRIVADRQFTIQVYPVTLPEQSLLVTNWYFPDKFSFMNDNESVEDDSPAYWECMRRLVETASAYGQNVWLLYETGTPVPTATAKG